MLGVTATVPARLPSGGASGRRTVFARCRGGSWRRLSCGAGSKGERALRLGAGDVARTVDGERLRWLLARRSLTRPERDLLLHRVGRAETPLDEMARVAGARWAIEESFETAKGEVGFDQYEVRSWARVVPAHHARACWRTPICR